MVFSQLPRGFSALLLLNRRWAETLRSRSSREGFSFLLPEQKKRNKENSPSALFCLLQSGIPLKKKNSLRSNSFFFLTLHPAPSASRQKSEAGPLCFLVQHRFACWGVVFSFFLLHSFLSSRAEQSVVKDLGSIAQSISASLVGV